jgi:hypothetical protein
MANRPLFLAIIGGGIALAAIILNFFPLDNAPIEPEQGKPAVQATAPKDSSAAPTVSIKPSFDIVRINPQGDTVIAGKSAPGAKIRIMDGDKEIGIVAADKRGEWVFVPKKPLPPGNRELALESTRSDGTNETSESVVVLAVPEQGKDLGGGESDQTNQTLAMRVRRDGGGATTLMQVPGRSDPALPIAIDSIDYDDQGRLTISGRAAKNAGVRIYLDNRFLGETSVNAKNRWSFRPQKAVSPGLYTLRADQVNRTGKVIARASIPFVRSEPITGLAPGKVVVVQPGNSLWRIARSTYGSGLRYHVIYEANKRQIKDADLIYPGQLFTLPTVK